MRQKGGRERGVGRNVENDDKARGNGSPKTCCAYVCVWRRMGMKKIFMMIRKI